MNKKIILLSLCFATLFLHAGKKSKVKAELSAAKNKIFECYECSLEARCSLVKIHTKAEEARLKKEKRSVAFWRKACACIAGCFVASRITSWNSNGNVQNAFDGSVFRGAELGEHSTITRGSLEEALGMDSGMRVTRIDWHDPQKGSRTFTIGNPFCQPSQVSFLRAVEKLEQKVKKGKEDSDDE